MNDCLTGNKQRWRATRSANRATGFSLIEVVAGMGVVSVVFLTIGSSLVLVARALPHDSPTQSLIRTASVMDEIVADLQLAISFQQRDARSVTFTVPDRTGDNVNEVIRYSWSGTAGDPLRRSINGGTDVVMLENVTTFDLTYKVQTRQIVTPTTYETAEMILRSQSGFLSILNSNITSSRWAAQYVVPNLPSDAISWRPTRVELVMAANGDRDGRILVQLRPQDAAQCPADTVLEERELLESNLPQLLGLSWYVSLTFNFNQTQGLSPDMGVCIVVRNGSSNSSPVVTLAHGGILGLFGTNMISTNNSGGSWTPELKSLEFYLYGRATRPGPDIVETKNNLLSINVRLRTANDVYENFAAVPILNRVEVPGS